MPQKRESSVFACLATAQCFQREAGVLGFFARFFARDLGAGLTLSFTGVCQAVLEACVWHGIV